MKYDCCRMSDALKAIWIAFEKVSLELCKRFRLPSDLVTCICCEDGDHFSTLSMQFKRPIWWLKWVQICSNNAQINQLNCNFHMSILSRGNLIIEYSEDFLWIILAEWGWCSMHCRSSKLLSYSSTTKTDSHCPAGEADRSTNLPPADLLHHHSE